MTHPGDVAVPVPFTSKLGSEITPGQTLNIHGFINSNATRAEVNLLSGTAEISPHVGQVALHVNLRFDEGKVILNTMSGGEWGKEKRVSNPFKAGDKFDLKIRVHEDKYEILANQKEIAEFEIRVPLNTIDHMQVKGDVVLNGVHWGGRYYKLPFETAFEGGHLRDGQRVYIYGIPKGDRFNIDFVAKNGDVLLHFNPRLKEKQVVRNSHIGDTWGQEEREGSMPFKKDIAFDLVIYNESYSMQIFVDGERIGTFAHRTNNPGSDYIGMRIAGDVDLTGIEFGRE